MADSTLQKRTKTKVERERRTAEWQNLLETTKSATKKSIHNTELFVQFCFIC